MADVISLADRRRPAGQGRKGCKGQQSLDLGLLVRLPAPGEERARSAEAPRRHRQVWSDDEEAWLQRRLDEGADYATVAAELGRTRRACFHRAWLKTMVIGADTCATCAKPITQPAVGPKRVYCSELCQRRASKPQRQLEITACPHCSRVFEQKDLRQRYCTRACSTAASHVRHKEQVHAKQAGTAGRALSGEELARALALHLAGHSLRGICRMTGYGFRQVRTAVQKYQQAQGA